MTTYRTVTQDKERKVTVFVDKPRTRMVQKQNVTYKKVKAIRYKLETFTETQMQKSSKMVKKTEIEL